MVSENFTVLLYTPQQYCDATGQPLRKIPDSVQIKGSLVRSFSSEKPPFPEFIEEIEQCRRQQRHHIVRVSQEIALVGNSDYKAFQLQVFNNRPHIVSVSHEGTLVEKVEMFPGNYYFIGSHQTQSHSLKPYAILSLSSES